MFSSLHRLSALVTAGTAALIPALPGLPPTYHGDQLGPKIGIVGDSITCLSTNDFNQDFQSDYNIQIGCKDGITVSQGTGYANQINHSLEGSPDAFIINLGTNDALEGEHETAPSVDDANVGQVWRNLDTLASDVSNVGCVIWVSVSEVPDVFGANIAQAINGWIYSRTHHVPGNYEIDWWGLLRQGDNANEWISSHDAIHTTQAGQQELANLYLQAIRTDCPNLSMLPSPPPGMPTDL